jgi:hypothetical protein
MRTRPLAVFRNLGDNSFEELLEAAGPGVAKAHRGRGCAFGDFDNDGEVDMLIINLNEDPSFCGTIFAETELDQGETRGSEVQSKCDRASGSGPIWPENAGSDRFGSHPASILRTIPACISASGTIL